jgi:uncharacterized protein YpuA (DUF1002 family)
MSKLLIEANLFQKLIDTFFKAKAAGKEDQFISKLQHADTEVGNAFNDLNQTMINNMVKLKKSLEKQNMDTTEIDNYLKTYANKI